MLPNETRIYRHQRHPARTATVTPSFDGIYTHLVVTVRVEGLRYPVESSASYRSMPAVTDWLQSRGYIPD
jgi:hypothetical protein